MMCCMPNANRISKLVRTHMQSILGAIITLLIAVTSHLLFKHYSSQCHNS